ncbi:hypothetical protein [Clostridium neonatale]|uniref:Uncharacterized protein n=1 Tax=Clostridium neonatale TaxID=137838 RepID=A0AA86JEC5_9CLOT|nr:hypothetical protein [Clostridium neonatale]CAG9703676.1 conserved hypothetical protein [Clostridium neonatale]CAI3539169.1 conserved hypothetical protein [Clostridium neonatale]CAI3540066.1 conserved hypothetical protein [Clostridium neonatale]CAI3545660.1 conserved hypothetical protein [Clostridium neonatale]CAI3552273.1 conserved hypothetical protein [Clostridium neonatale]
MEIKIILEINTIKELGDILQEIRKVREEHPIIGALSLEIIVKY